MSFMRLRLVEETVAARPITHPAVKKNLGSPTVWIRAPVASQGQLRMEV